MLKMDTKQIWVRCQVKGLNSVNWKTEGLQMVVHIDQPDQHEPGFRLLGSDDSYSDSSGEAHPHIYFMYRQANQTDCDTHFYRIHPEDEAELERMIADGWKPIGWPPRDATE